MSQELLHGPDVMTGGQQVGRERMSQCVRRRRLCNAGPARSFVNGALDDLLSQMMPPLDSASRVSAAVSGRKDPLSWPGSIRIRILHRQRIRHPHSSKAFRYIAIMKLSHPFEMLP